MRPPGEAAGTRVPRTVAPWLGQAGIVSAPEVRRPTCCPATPKLASKALPFPVRGKGERRGPCVSRGWWSPGEPWLRGGRGCGVSHGRGSSVPCGCSGVCRVIRRKGERVEGPTGSPSSHPVSWWTFCLPHTQNTQPLPRQPPRPTQALPPAQHAGGGPCLLSRHGFWASDDP